MTLPYDEAFAEAVRRLYRTGLFSDVEVVADRVVGDGVFLLIRVEEEPRLGSYTIEGVSGGQRDDLEDELPLLRGRAVRPSDIGQSVQLIERYFIDEGYRQAHVRVERGTDDDGRVALTFHVRRGDRIKIEEVRFEGNTAYGDGTLEKAP